MGAPSLVIKRSTLAHMRLAVATLAAAGAAAVSSASLPGCGKEPLNTDTSQGANARVRRLPDGTITPLAGKDAGPKPPPDPCPACGMG